MRGYSACGWIPGRRGLVLRPAVAVVVLLVCASVLWVAPAGAAVGGGEALHKILWPALCGCFAVAEIVEDEVAHFFRGFRSFRHETGQQPRANDPGEEAADEPVGFPRPFLHVLVRDVEASGRQSAELVEQHTKKGVCVHSDCRFFRPMQPQICGFRVWSQGKRRTKTGEEEPEEVG